MLYSTVQKDGKGEVGIGPSYIVFHVDFGIRTNNNAQNASEKDPARA